MLNMSATKKVMCDCFFPQYKASFGSSPWRRRTKCEVRREQLLTKNHIVVAESDAIHMQCSVVSFKTARRRVVQTMFANRVRQLRAVSIRSPRLVWLFLDFGQSQFKQEQLICVGCLMMAGIERWESHECNKLGQLRKDRSVYKKRIV